LYRLEDGRKSEESDADAADFKSLLEHATAEASVGNGGNDLTERRGECSEHKSSTGVLKNAIEDQREKKNRGGPPEGGDGEGGRWEGGTEPDIRSPSSGAEKSSQGLNGAEKTVSEDEIKDAETNPLQERTKKPS